MIGAPRFHSTFSDQTYVKESGGIFKCNFNGECQQYPFDESPKNENIISTYKKDYQWLGAVMDGDIHGDQFVVCAPRHVTFQHNGEEALHGSCYRTSDTICAQPSQFEPIRSLNKIGGIS